MRFLWAAILVLFTLVCWPAAAWFGLVADVAASALAQVEESAHQLLARLATLLTAAPATLVIAPVIGWAGFAMKRSWVTWLAFGLVAVHALAVVETVRQLDETCTSFTACLAG